MAAMLRRWKMAIDNKGPSHEDQSKGKHPPTLRVGLVARHRCIICVWLVGDWHGLGKPHNKDRRQQDQPQAICRPAHVIQLTCTRAPQAAAYHRDCRCRRQQCCSP